MIPEITNNNVHLLIPGKAALFARIYTEQNGGTMLEALRAFYSSKMYHELEDESTKLWHLGPVALYEDFEKENKTNIRINK